MNILVIGGTQFVGRHFVEAALLHGHKITLFHRGKTGHDLFPEAEHIHGDRDGGLDVLGDRMWDAVFDSCGYVPRIVRQSAEALSGRAEAYLFVSTVSIYEQAHPAGTPIDENHPQKKFDKVPDDEAVTGETYGPFKVLCEEAVNEAFKGRIIHVRPGLIIGAYDSTDRFTYWVDRFQRSGPVLIPKPLTGTIQLIDAGDLARLMLKLLEDKAEGAFNAVAPAKPVSYQEMIDAVRSNTVGAAHTVEADEAWIQEQGVKPWSDLPLWLPSSMGDEMGPFDASKAIAAGLTMRPLGDSVRDIDAWHASRPQPVKLKTGLTRERELALIAAWESR